MRAGLVSHIDAILHRHGDPNKDLGRWEPVQEWILTKILGFEIPPNIKIKTLRQKVHAVDLNNLELILFTANPPDHVLFELFEIVMRRYMTQR
ncbi:MAG TPA: hypothetical protein VFM18_18925 [Methanosarcina sp.]|nr:hypothetical protein [Methanosarcina sp.]